MSTISFASFERAIREDRIETLQDPNAPFKNGVLPLHLAVHRRASKEFVDKLLAQGANPYVEDGAGCTALDHARKVEDETRREQLLSHLTPITAEQLKQVKEECKIIEERMQKAATSLKAALDVLEIDKFECSKVCAELIQGEEVTATTREGYGITPLHHVIQAHGSNYVIRSGEKEIGGIKELEKAMETLTGPTQEITKKTVCGLTAAHFAVHFKSHKALELLVAHPQKKELLTSTTLTGLTALHIALMKGDYVMAHLLVQHAPELLTMQDKNGLTPLQMHLQYCQSHDETWHEKSGDIKLSEFTLLAVYALVPLLKLGYEAYFEADATCPTGLVSSIPIILGALIASPPGIKGLLLNGGRLERVFSTTFNPLLNAFRYASYEPGASLRKIVVHLGAAVGSIGLVAFNWWNS